jgi:hypothetical protein
VQDVVEGDVGVDEDVDVVGDNGLSESSVFDDETGGDGHVGAETLEEGLWTMTLNGSAGGGGAHVSPCVYRGPYVGMEDGDVWKEEGKGVYGQVWRSVCDCEGGSIREHGWLECGQLYLRV